MKAKPPKPATDLIEAQRERIYYERISEHGRRFAAFDALTTLTVLDFIHAANLMTNRLTALLNRFELSVSAFNILIILQLTPQRQLKMNEISRLLLFTKANISFLVKTLERKNLIEIVPNTRDKRARQLKITETGEKLLDQVLPAQITHENNALAALSVEEKETLRRLLAKISSTAEKPEV